MTKEWIFFDLDGTLTDPQEGITKSIAYALKKYNIAVKDLNELIPFIGPPLGESFSKFYGFSNEQACQAVEYYREYFKVKGLYENGVYPGIKHLLRQLKDQGKKLAVATSKPTVFSEQIIAHFGLKPYFELVAGSTLDGSRIKKGDVIAFALAELQLDSAQVLMVGDREHDVIGARENGMDCAAVGYGYGSRQELEAAGPQYLVQTVFELEQLLMGIH